MNAVMLRADWRPTMGLTDDDRGTVIERIIQSAVIEASVETHNKNVS